MKPIIAIALGLALGACATPDATRTTEEPTVKARPTQNAAVQDAAASGQPAMGRKVYDASECIGPVIMGECKGSILPNKAYHPTCHGEWLNGQCTGPMF